jgi:hypothetical protein
MGFETVFDVQRVVPNVIKKRDFHNAFGVWEEQWDHYIYSQGDCFEDGNQNLGS